MRRCLLRLALPALLALLALAAAQPRLVIDGLDLPGNTTTLVAGRSYAPARALALALGAELSVDGSRRAVTMQLGGTIVSIALTADAAGAAAANDAISVDGRAVAGGAGVTVGGEVYLPVQPLIEALGGSVAFLPEEGAVVAVMPRARLEGASLDPAGERLRLTVSTPVGHSVFFNEPISTLQIRLDRTDLMRAQTLSGAAIERVDLIPVDGHVDVRVSIPREASYRLYTLPAGGGRFELIVELAAPSEPPVALPTGIVLDAGHGGDEPGTVFGTGGAEADLTQRFVTGLERELAELGFRVSATRVAEAVPSLASRRSAGVGADLFVSIHAADLPAGRYNLYHLADAGDERSYQLALTGNAEAALRSGVTDRVRRDILLGLSGDLELGRRYADSFERQLLQLAGYQVGEALGAPLYVLSGAAGRGLMLEFAPSDLRDPGFAQLVAKALAAALALGGAD